MNIDGNLIPLAAIGVGFIITITAILADSISKYKLKVEQIRADALVRAEEVKAKNQLELEKLLHAQEGNAGRYGANHTNPGQSFDDADRVKSRVRE